MNQPAAQQLIPFDGNRQLQPPETFPARRSDPATSQQAARQLIDSGEIGERQRAAFVALCRWPGMTARELERQAGVADGVFRKRMKELERKGRARTGQPKRCSISGKSCQTWWPATRRLPQ